MFPTNKKKIFTFLTIKLSCHHQSQEACSSPLSPVIITSCSPSTSLKRYWSKKKKKIHFRGDLTDITTFLLIVFAQNLRDNPSALQAGEKTGDGSCPHSRLIPSREPPFRSHGSLSVMEEEGKLTTAPNQLGGESCCCVCLDSHEVIRTSVVWNDLFLYTGSVIPPWISLTSLFILWAVEIAEVLSLPLSTCYSSHSPV